MLWLHYIAYGVEAIAYAASALLWLKASRIRIPIVEATYAGIDQILPLSQSVSEASQWNKWAAIGAAVGAGVHILGMAL
jgi:hypothetical protein